MGNHPSLAIVGLGAFYPGAHDVNELWENVLSRRREFRKIPERRLSSAYIDADPTAPDKTYATRAAVLDGFTFDWAARGIPRSTFESTDIVHWLALEVALAALADAGYARDRLPANATGVFVGNTLTGEQTRSQSLRARWPFVRRALVLALEAHGVPDIDRIAATAEVTMKSVLPPTTEDTLAGGRPNTIAGRICSALGVHGGGYAVDGGCASSLLAVTTGAAALERGDLDIALVGGVDVSIDPFELVRLAKASALTPGDMNVYDRRAAGVIAGEGCGFIVLRRLDDAEKAGDRVYAVLKGWGISSDGREGVAAPDSDGQALAMERAYARAGYSPTTLTFVEGHGTGSVASDSTELLGLALALRRAGGAPPRAVGVTSLTSILGHTKAAAGIGGLIKATLAVSRRVIPPTAGCADPSAVFEESEGASLYPILKGAVLPADTRVRAGVSAIGLGGISCHVTIESAGPPDPRVAPRGASEPALLASSQETELFVLAGPDGAGLVEEAGRLAEGARGASPGDLVDLSAMLATRIQPGAARAAIVASTPEEVIESAAEIRDLLAEAERAGSRTACSKSRRTWVGLGTRPVRVGFLFPGQGSQSLGMAETLVHRYAWGRELVEQAEQWLERAGTSIPAIMFRPTDRVSTDAEFASWRDELSATENAQPAICLASLLWLRRLRELGIQPVAVGGHSLGELTAFHAAGAFDERALLCLAALRGRAMAAPAGTAGAMMSLKCDREQADRLVAGVDGYVVVANVNSPTQIVVSGERRAVEKLAELARAATIKTRMLAVSNAFHSRLVEEAGRILREEADLPERLGDREIAISSGVPGVVLDASTGLSDHFAMQVTAPVDFVGLARDLAARVDVLLEVGPGKVLAALVRDILGEGTITSWPVEPIAGRDAEFNLTLAALHVLGVPVRWSALCEARLVRPFRPAAERQFIENPCEHEMQVPEHVRSR
jgi:acyl transferase domain-containing protein